MVVKLDHIDYNLAAGDWLHIFDEDPSNVRTRIHFDQWKGWGLPRNNVISRYSTMRIRLRTDAASTDTGFSYSYTG